MMPAVLARAADLVEAAGAVLLVVLVNIFAISTYVPVGLLICSCLTIYVRDISSSLIYCCVFCFHLLFCL